MRLILIFTDELMLLTERAKISTAYCVLWDQTGAEIYQEFIFIDNGKCNKDIRCHI